ncbi:hypothetical protein [Nocardia abscessus]|uniref:hypothetical protein n=1 Tax=Nocardia abscessus TaxID=120957 RepID=UPI002454D53F|nr:hypothetical protein [Nocardia abscessus]
MHGITGAPKSSNAFSTAGPAPAEPISATACGRAAAASSCSHADATPMPSERGVARPACPTAASTRRRPRSTRVNAW